MVVLLILRSGITMRKLLFVAYSPLRGAETCFYH